MKDIKQAFTKENIIKGLKWFFFSFIWLAILMFIIDIVSKTLVKANMDVLESYTLIPNFLHITYVQNNKMAFSLGFEDDLTNAIVFITVSLLGTAIILFAYIKYFKKLTKIGKASVMLMLAGTVGNLIDRCFYVNEEGQHFVVDFIDFQFGPTYHFATFNIADSCLVIGVIMLVIDLIYLEIKAEKEKKKEEELQLANGGDVAKLSEDAITTDVESEPEAKEIKEGVGENDQTSSE